LRRVRECLPNRRGVRIVGVCLSWGDLRRSVCPPQRGQQQLRRVRECLPGQLDVLLVRLPLQ
jgi:hypothetical protein